MTAGKTTDIGVRPATRSDVAAIRALLVELGYADLATDGALESTLEAVLADRERRVWLAERAGRSVGMISISIRPQLRLAGLLLVIEELVVQDEARGSGIGTTLLEIARNEALRLGVRRVELVTNRSRPAYRRRFYAERGFTEVDSALMRWAPAGLKP